MKKQTLTDRFEELGRHLDRLPEIDEPPPTTLQLLGQSRQEGDWQRFLSYFLSPEAPHGLEHAAVEEFLKGLTNRDDIDFEFSRFDLDDIDVETEVYIPDGRVDLLIWCEEDWLVLCELKIDSSEGDGQTKKYANVKTFANIELDPTNVPENRRHYLYITPNGAEPDSCEFAAVEWSWVASQLRTVQQSDYGSYPARTTGQLDDFIDTIETELTMTDHERNETAKAGLYVDYYDEIAEVKESFESEWGSLIDSWGRRLSTTLEGANLVEEPEGVPAVPDNDVMLELPDGDNRTRYWLCRQSNGKWSWFYPTDWWTDLDTGQPIYHNSGSNARVGFLHRPEFDRNRVLKEKKLTFYLRNAPSGNDEFYPRFAELFNSNAAIAEALPENSERRGVKSNVIEATYSIEVSEYQTLFDGYISALATAVDDHILSNHKLIEEIDSLYQQTLSEVRDGSFE
jgi:hypothetical protein